MTQIKRTNPTAFTKLIGPLLRFCVLSWALACAFLIETNATEGQLRAKVYFENLSSQSVIPGFALKLSEPEVIIIKNEESHQYEHAVVIEGKFNNKDWTLGLSRKKDGKPSLLVKSTPDQVEQPVSITVFLPTNLTKIYMTASPSTGPVIRDSISIETDKELFPKPFETQKPTDLDPK